MPRGPKPAAISDACQSLARDNRKQVATMVGKDSKVVEACLPELHSENSSGTCPSVITRQCQQRTASAAALAALRTSKLQTHTAKRYTPESSAAMRFVLLTDGRMLPPATQGGYFTSVEICNGGIRLPALPVMNSSSGSVSVFFAPNVDEFVRRGSQRVHGSERRRAGSDRLFSG